MKKTILFALAAVAALGFSACNNSTATTKDSSVSRSSSERVLYSGILPSADALGTVYTIRLNYDDNRTSGDYEMLENTLAGDTTTASGLKEVYTAYTEGDFHRASKQVDGATVEYLQLEPDKNVASAPMYFVINADNSITMVGEDLVKTEMPGMNYTLTAK